MMPSPENMMKHNAKVAIAAAFRRFMYMFDISEDQANLIFNWSNVLLVVSVVLGGIAAVGGMVGTIGTIWGSTVAAGYAAVKTKGMEEDIAEANARAAIANTNTEDAKVKIAELELARVEVERQLEGERSARMELIRAVAPRSIEQLPTGKSLADFKGMQVLLAPIDDYEAVECAGQLQFLFEAVGRWKVVRRAPEDARFDDGIVVLTNVGALPKSDRSIAAAEELVKILQTQKIDASRRPHPRQNLPENTLVVLVGRKPKTFFNDALPPSWAKEAVGESDIKSE
jgi:soluble cytochrome b562